MNINENQTSPNTETSNPYPELVDAAKLLEMLFSPECRPTVRWLRTRQQRREIPFVKLGRLVFFNPIQVKEALARQATVGRNR